MKQKEVTYNYISWTARQEEAQHGKKAKNKTGRQAW